MTDCYEHPWYRSSNLQYYVCTTIVQNTFVQQTLVHACCAVWKLTYCTLYKHLLLQFVTCNIPCLQLTGLLQLIALLLFIFACFGFLHAHGVEFECIIYIFSVHLQSLLQKSLS